MTHSRRRRLAVRVLATSGAALVGLRTVRALSSGASHNGEIPPLLQAALLPDPAPTGSVGAGNGPPKNPRIALPSADPAPMPESTPLVLSSSVPDVPEAFASVKTLGASVLLTAVLSGVFLAVSPSTHHWFALPVGACGVLIGTDAIDWLRGRRPVLDPIGLVGIFGYFFFFLAPFLHVTSNYWMKYVIGPADWRPWLGWFGVINLAGIAVYRATRSVPALRHPAAAVWRVREHRFMLLAMLALVVTGALQVAIYAHEGGVSGYIHAYADNPHAFRGLGWIFAISESFPMVAMLAYAVWARGRKHANSVAVLAVILACFFIAKIFFGGLRGSRSNIVFDLVWALGVIHVWLRPISRRMIVAGSAVLVAFMYGYGFYKERDLVSSGQLGSASARSAVAATRGRDLKGVLLGDLGRSDVQAFLLYRVRTHRRTYHWAWGITYVNDVLSLVPSAVWPHRPTSVVKQGTQAQYGTQYAPGHIYSTRQYGLAGEALLNFGPWITPLAFIVLGLYVRFLTVQRWVRDPWDSRRLIYPFLVVVAPILLVSDLDNLMFYVLEHALVPTLVVIAASRRWRTRPRASR